MEIVFLLQNIFHIWSGIKTVGPQISVYSILICPILFTMGRASLPPMSSLTMVSTAPARPPVTVQMYSTGHLSPTYKYGELFIGQSVVF